MVIMKLQYFVFKLQFIDKFSDLREKGNCSHTYLITYLHTYILTYIYNHRVQFCSISIHIITLTYTQS